MILADVDYLLLAFYKKYFIVFIILYCAILFTFPELCLRLKSRSNSSIIISGNMYKLEGRISAVVANLRNSLATNFPADDSKHINQQHVGFDLMPLGCT